MSLVPTYPPPERRENLACNEIVTPPWTAPSRSSPIVRPMTERARKVDAGRLRVIPGGSPTPAPSYRLLTQVSAALSTSLDLDRTLKEILERMNALVAFDAATIFLLDDSRRELHVKAALGVPVALKEVKSFKLGEGVVGWVVSHAATALIQDSSKDARYNLTGPERRAKTVLAAPLRAQDKLLGALVLVRAAKEPFGPEHQRLVEAIQPGRRGDRPCSPLR